MAVVDPALRVRGVDALRVVDSSVMPSLTTGNLNAPTIMIGEKGADHILGAALIPTPRRNRQDDASGSRSGCNMTTRGT